MDVVLRKVYGAAAVPDTLTSEATLHGSVMSD